MFTSSLFGLRWSDANVARIDIFAVCAVILTKIKAKVNICIVETMILIISLMPPLKWFSSKKKKKKDQLAVMPISLIHMIIWKGRVSFNTF